MSRNQLSKIHKKGSTFSNKKNSEINKSSSYFQESLNKKMIVSNPILTKTGLQCLIFVNLITDLF